MSNTQQLLRNIATYEITPANAGTMKIRMLNWAQQFSILIFLDSNNYPSLYAGYECLLAAGANQVIGGKDNGTLLQLQQAHDTQPDWMFGHICYDYKNVTEPGLSSRHAANHGFPLLQFFVPETVCYMNREQSALTIESFGDPAQILSEIMATSATAAATILPHSFSGTTDKASYINTIAKLRKHIADGDCYEINYCTGGHAENAAVNPLQTFHALNNISPAPFAAFYRLDHLYMMCASPERYLRKEGAQILSQPIKGTARRDKDPGKDNLIKQTLQNDIKERAENVMIVDLVRNDLARCCKTGSVQVDELFGIYSFPQVHQMISTVSGLLNEDATFTEAISATFPMGSMTGAPKYKVMQLIEQYEVIRRELFSGTVGYITPSGDFDFNVIIRSLFYNEETSYLSYQAGGAITFDSVPESEWEEMRLKAWAMERIFSEKNTG